MSNPYGYNHPTQQYEPAPSPPPKKKRVWLRVIGITLGAIALFSFGFMSRGTSNTPLSAPPPPVASVSAPTNTYKVTPETPRPGIMPAPVTAAPAPPPPPAPEAPAKAITARQWQLIAKDPNAHIGERIIVYGQVTQFDTNTSAHNFRAYVDGVVHKPSYGYVDYTTNTMMMGLGPVDLSQVVEKDLFKAEVTVMGALDYETTLGGQLSVPNLSVTKIEILGQAK